MKRPIQYILAPSFMRRTGDPGISGQKKLIANESVVKDEVFLDDSIVRVPAEGQRSVT
jgi:hypothetical protein